jgi:hypothetical protein
MGEKIFKRNADILLRPDCNVLVDSGAFTAWGSGKRIDLNKYGQFCQKLASDSQCAIRFVNLDVIPGRKGGGYIPRKQRDVSAREGWKNYQFLSDEMGLRVMPVFHQFDSFDWLQRMAAETDYIGISPSNDSSVSRRAKEWWLDNVFVMIGSRLRTHAFGNTSQFLLRYPFYSVDSTTWMNGDKFRSMLLFGGIASSPIGVGQLNRKRIIENLGNPRLRTDKHVIPFMRSAKYRVKRGVQAFLEFEFNCTELWDCKGIRWPGTFLRADGRGAMLDGQKLAAARLRSMESACADSVREGIMRSVGRKSTDSLSPILRLRGARLSVFLVYCLTAESDGRARKSLAELEDETGLKEDAITKARAWLKRNGWLVRERKEQDGRFTRLEDQKKSETGGNPDWHRARIP